MHYPMRLVAMAPAQTRIHYYQSRVQLSFVYAILLKLKLHLHITHQRQFGALLYSIGAVENEKVDQNKNKQITKIMPTTRGVSKRSPI